MDWSVTPAIFNVFLRFTKLAAEYLMNF
jgi:hypothetical protein